VRRARGRALGARRASRREVHSPSFRPQNPLLTKLEPFYQKLDNFEVVQRPGAAAARAKGFQPVRRARGRALGAMRALRREVHRRSFRPHNPVLTKLEPFYEKLDNFEVLQRTAAAGRDAREVPGGQAGSPQIERSRFPELAQRPGREARFATAGWALERPGMG